MNVRLPADGWENAALRSIAKSAAHSLAAQGNQVWRSGSPSGQTPETLVRSHEQFSLRRREGSVGRFLNRIGRQNFEFWPGPQHKNVARLVRHIDFVPRQQHRRPGAAAASRTCQPFLPNLLSRLQFQARSHAVRADRINMALIDDAGADGSLDPVQTPKPLA